MIEIDSSLYQCSQLLPWDCSKYFALKWTRGSTWVM